MLAQERYAESNARHGEPNQTVIKFLTRQLLQEYCRVYLKWLDRNYVELFECPRGCGCLRTAPIIIMDGTSLGANAVYGRNAPWPCHETVPPREDVAQGAKRTGSLFDHRCFITSHDLRTSVLDLCRSKPNPADHVRLMRSFSHLLLSA